MPIFDYKCEDCGAQFEELVSSSDSTVACPTCESDKTRKLLSAFATSSGSSGSTAPACGSGSGGCGSGFG